MLLGHCVQFVCVED